MLKRFAALSICAAALTFVVACNSSSGGGGSSTQGTIVSPNSLDKTQYPDVRGQVFGTWSAHIDAANNDNTQIHADLAVYINQTQTAVRITCSKRGVVFADLAGVVNSSISGNNITFNQSVDLEQDSCSFKVPQQTMQFDLNSDRNEDTLDIDPGGNQLELKRSTPPDDHHDRPHVPQPQPRPSPGIQQPGNPGFGGDQFDMVVYSAPNCQGRSITLNDNQSCLQQVRSLGRVNSVMMNGQCQSLSQEMSPDQFCQSQSVR